MMTPIKTHFLFAIIIITFFSCRKDTPPVLLQQGSTNLSSGKHLIICDEGNYGQNNAVVSFFDPLNNAIVVSAFAASNPNYTLGDIIQSVCKIAGNYYLVINNSGKIVVCNSSFVRISTINGLLSPRYIQYAFNDKAYVSSFKLPANPNQTNYIQVLDIHSNTVIKTIRLDGWTEEMQLSNGNIYVTNQNKKYVYVINTQTDVLTDSIYVGASSACIIKDENGKIWVSCNADAANNISAKLIKINPANNSIEATISLNTTQNSISRLCINGSGNTLYYLMNDVFKMDINSITATNIIPQSTHTFYGLCIDSDDETIYVSDAVDYNSNGKLYRYQSNASLAGTYTVGLIPGFMMIDE